MIFDQTSRQSAEFQLHQLDEKLDKTYPDAATLLVDAEQDILAYKSFPKEHWRRIRSTNLLERVNKEVKHRTKVVGVFPDRPSVVRLVGSILNEIDDDWRASQRRYFSKESMHQVTDPDLAYEDQPSIFMVELTTNINTEALTNLHH